MITFLIIFKLKFNYLVGNDYGLARLNDGMKNMVLPTGNNPWTSDTLTEVTSPRTTPQSGILPSPGSGTPVPSPLEQEFKLMNIDLPNLYVDKVRMNSKYLVIFSRIISYQILKL